MKTILFLMLLILQVSCATMPQLYQAAEDIANDEAVEIKISREAIQKQTDVTVSVDIKNTPTASK